MITLEKAKGIAQKQFPDFPVFDIRDIGSKWAFSYDTPIPGIPFVCISKSNGDINYLTVPPIENLKIIENGKVIYPTE